MTVHCQLPSYVILYLNLLNSVVTDIFLVLILTCNDSLIWKFALLKYILQSSSCGFFSLYFMKGTKLHWNICCYKRENVDVIWIRLDTTMQCRGINRKDCSQVTDFGNFGFQSLLRRLGVLEKKLKVGSAAPRRLSIFFPKPPTSGAGFETKISKVRHLRAVFTLEI